MVMTNDRYLLEVTGLQQGHLQVEYDNMDWSHVITLRLDSLREFPN
jgi:hypothetical protein